MNKLIATHERKDFKKIFRIIKKIKEVYASLSEYTDANRVKLNGVVIVHLNKIPELVGELGALG